MEAAADEVMRALVRHQWVRIHGTPRVSVLVGEPRRAHAVWTEWAALVGAADAPLIDAGASLDRPLRAAIASAERAPAAPAALAVRPAALARFLTGRDDRWAALVREGRIDLPTRARRRDRGSRDDRARSLAELALFEALEATAATAGRFALNQRVPIRFGPGDLEIDLLDRAARIAIEVDGFHHFGDAERYRTDRRKDLVLQGAGFLVVRVLADDVHADPRPAVRAVCEALAHRQREAAR